MNEWITSLISAFVKLLVDRTDALIRPELVTFLGRNHIDKPLLEKLKMLLLLAATVLNDAEEKQFIDPSVKEWFDELQNAAYNADDLLDEIANANVIAANVNAPEEKLAKVKKYLSSLNPLVEGNKSKLDRIFELLKFMVEHKDNLGLKEGGVGKSLSLPSATTSLVDEHQVRGRNDDREKIIDFLVSNREGMSVVAIVGMGGIGKTTLAQILYNDKRVRNRFQLRSWASISQTSNVCEITKKVFESFTLRCSYSNITDLNVLQIRLKERLARQRFLLVLDGFWNENFLDWNILRKPFLSGGRGSKIIVTTRSQSVAAAIRADLTHSLSLLSNEDTWELFLSHAFKYGNSDLYPDLEEIGQEIVKKCKGLPLAAKALGSLLCSKQDAEEWENISNSKIWELPSDKSILPALSLSYIHLPSLLKRCFAYCSIFPKGHEIEKWDLIYLWMAEGILPETEKRREDVGDKCFQELLSRSFFHHSNRDKSRFMMHDLINDLAQFVAGDFCYHLADNNPRKIKTRARHLSYLQDKYEAPQEFVSLIECQQLRTFLAFRSSKSGSKPVFPNMVQMFLEKQNTLRVLSLSNYEITKFTSPIGRNSLHIRYLNLAHTDIECLPPDVCNWYNLETLILSCCGRLKKLPKNMFKLVNLRHLDISQSGVIDMPAEFGRLKSLQVLTDFIVSNSIGEGSKISELGELSELRGALLIGNLQNVVDELEASSARLSSKKYLHELSFKWKATTHDDDVPSQTKVLSMLVPHQNVKRLIIQNFGGNQLPNWLGSPGFSRMVFLHLVNCEVCKSLPPLGQLPSLKELYISNVTRLQRVGPEFYGYVKEPFKSLKIIKFGDMPSWAEWSTRELEQGVRFPSLQELHISRCPKLIGRLPNQLPSLDKLVITACQAMNGSFAFSSMVFLQLVDCESCLSVSPLGQLPSLKELYISKMRSLKKVGSEFFGNVEPFKSLKIMKFEDMPNWEEWSHGELKQGVRFPSLKELRINRCPKLVGTLPDQLPSLDKLVITGCQAFSDSMPRVPKLRVFELTECSALKSLSNRMMEGNDCLDTMTIGDCSSLTNICKDGLPRTLKLLKVSKCRKLKLFDSQSPCYPALKQLYLKSCCDSLISIPLYLFTNLEELYVQDCKELTKISAAPNSLPYLRKLELKDCSQLGSFPEGELPAAKLEMTSLTSLHISGLPSLTSLEHIGLQCMESLKTLEIKACDKLESLPLDRLVHFLSHLTIRACPMLKQLCERYRGEYWSRISRIPAVIIED